MSFGYIIFVVIKQNNSRSRTDTAELALHVLLSLWFVYQTGDKHLLLQQAFSIVFICIYL